MRTNVILGEMMRTAFKDQQYELTRTNLTFEIDVQT